MGLVTAGLAFALQRVITAFAGYILILRGSTFNVYAGAHRVTAAGFAADAPSPPPTAESRFQTPLP